MDLADSRFGSPSTKHSFRLVVQTLYMSIALGESRRDVYARPYFRGRAVCSRADIGSGARLAGLPAWRDAAINRPSGRRKYEPGRLCQVESRSCATRRTGGVTDR